MATTMVNVRMDAELKKGFEAVCNELGMSVSTAITIFAKTVAREQRIPFELAVDPFYSEPNLSHIMRGIEQLKAGKGVMHDIIEADDNE